jgi:hypothetical protein
MTDAANTMTRRTLVVGAAACVICAPAIVRAASLMPVRGVPLQLPNLDRKVPKTMGEWYRLCFYENLEQNLRAGRCGDLWSGRGQSHSGRRGETNRRKGAGTGVASAPSRRRVSLQIRYYCAQAFRVCKFNTIGTRALRCDDAPVAII